MTASHRFTIDRRVWDRGLETKLLNPETQKMCCVGIYLESLGVSKESLKGKTTAQKLAELPVSAEWLVEKVTGPLGAASSLARSLYHENDTLDLSAAEREKAIARLFAEAPGGIDVEFTG